MAGRLPQCGYFFRKGSNHFKNLRCRSFLEQFITAVNSVMDGNQTHDLDPAHLYADGKFPHPHEPRY